MTIMSDKNLPPVSGVIDEVPMSYLDDSNLETSKASADNLEASSVQNEAEKMQDLKSTLLDSAELATRGASLAVKAGVEMHHAAEKLMTSSVSQQKFSKIILLAFGATMTVAIVLFVVMAFRMQSKISQLDAMVLAVGKRVVSMDSSIELVATSSDLIKDFSTKQDAFASAQVKLENKIDESIKAALVVPDQKLKPAEDVNKDLKQLVQNLDLKIQAQASTIKSISSQIQKLQSSLPDPTNFKRDLEAASRLLKERQALDVAPNPPTAPLVKPKEKIVQFPRIAQPANNPDKP